MSEQEILHELKALSQKVDRLFSFIESTRAEQQSRRAARNPKPKLAPVTPEESQQHQARFAELYEQWLSGAEWECRKSWIKLRWKNCVASRTPIT